MIDPGMLALLACPVCETRPPLKEDAAKSQLVCTACGRTYPVRDGIPIMLVDQHG